MRYIDPTTRAVFGRSYADEPDALVEQLRGDEAIQVADTLLLTVPTQLGVACCPSLISNVIENVAKPLGWK